MALVVIILFSVVIIRSSVVTEYRPEMWMGPYGVVSGLSVFLLAGFHGNQAVLFGLLSAGLMWIWLKLMDKTDGTVFWWPLMIPGVLIPVWLGWILSKVAE